MLVYNGGQIPIERLNSALTILNGANPRVMHYENDPVDFVFFSQNPWPGAPQQPDALAILFEDRIDVIDLKTESLAPMALAHGLELHHARTTALATFRDCSSQLISALKWAQSSSTGPAKKPWCLSGGKGGKPAIQTATLLVTGHEDGSVCFWDMTGGVFYQFCLISPDSAYY